MTLWDTETRLSLGSMKRLDMALCCDVAEDANGGAPRLLVGGGSGGFISDNAIDMWRVLPRGSHEGDEAPADAATGVVCGVCSESPEPPSQRVRLE